MSGTFISMVKDAKARGLSIVHEGHEYVFCGKGCFLEFRDDPDRFLGGE